MHFMNICIPSVLVQGCEVELAAQAGFGPAGAVAL